MCFAVTKIIGNCAVLQVLYSKSLIEWYPAFFWTISIGLLDKKTSPITIADVTCHKRRKYTLLKWSVAYPVTIQYIQDKASALSHFILYQDHLHGHFYSSARHDTEAICLILSEGLFVCHQDTPACQCNTGSQTLPFSS